MTKSFPAGYPGICIKCGKAYPKGAAIRWNRLKGASSQTYHNDCANPDAKPVEPIEATHTDVAKLQETLNAAIEKLRELSGAAIPVPATPLMTAAEATLAPAAPLTFDPLALPTPKASPTKPKATTLKENAQWFDLLSSITSSFSGELIRVLLLGPPGTGKSKTSLVLTGTPYRVTMTEGMGVEDLIGMYQLIKGETVWVDGPVVRAMREGVRILIDEIDHHPTEVGSLLYALLDDSPSIMLPTGEEVKAKEGYGVIATTNSNVTALPEAVLDRFEAILPAIQPHPDALSQFDNTSMRDAVANHFRGLVASPWQWSGKPTLRRMRAYSRLLPVVGEGNAAKLAFGEAGKELLGVLTTSARGKL